MKYLVIFLTAFGVLLTARWATSGDDDKNWTGTPQDAFLKSEIVQSYQCTSCHTIGERGGTVGPILNFVGTRRDEAWLRKWLADPQLVKPGTKMPNFDLPPAHLDATVAYLTSMKKSLRTDEILLNDISLVEKGESLFEDYGCIGCHRLGLEGRFVGPDLTWVGIRKTENWEQTWLKDPQAFKPDTFMPNFHIPVKGVEAIAAFLHTQQGQHNKESQEWEFRTNFFLGNIDKERGELVFKRYACWSCHGESGSGRIKNPNMAPDEMMPGLKKVGNDFTEAQFAARLREKVVPETLNRSETAPPFFCPDYGNHMEASELSDLYAYLKSFAPKKNKWRFK